MKPVYLLITNLTIMDSKVASIDTDDLVDIRIEFTNLVYRFLEDHVPSNCKVLLQLVDTTIDYPVAKLVPIASGYSIAGLHTILLESMEYVLARYHNWKIVEEVIS